MSASGHSQPTSFPEQNVDAATFSQAVSAFNSARRADQTNRSFNYPEPDLLPGKLPAVMRDSCGDPMTRICEHCGDTYMGSYRCQRSLCPACWQSWVMRRTVAAGSRLSALRAMLDAKSDSHQKLHHVVASPPENVSYASENPNERLLQQVNDFLRALETPAFAVYHSYRIRDNAGVHDEQAAGPQDPEESHADKLGQWKWVLNAEGGMDEIRHRLHPHAHVHLIVVTDHFPGDQFTKRLYDETGWIVKRITKQSNNASIYDDHDLARVISYSLSHASIYEDSNGDYQARIRYYSGGLSGPDSNNIWDDVEVLDHYRDDFDRTVREVAATTLGVPFAETSCQTTVLNPASLQVDVARARASAGDSSSSSSSELPDANNADVSAEVQINSGNTGTGTDTLLPDDPGAGVVLEDAEPCYGRLLAPWDARELVVDDDWREQARYPDRALKAVRDYYRDKDGPPPDDLMAD